MAAFPEAPKPPVDRGRREGGTKLPVLPGYTPLTAGVLLLLVGGDNVGAAVAGLRTNMVSGLGVTGAAACLGEEVRAESDLGGTSGRTDESMRGSISEQASKRCCRE